MKNLKVTLAIILFSISTIVSAAVKTEGPIGEDLRTEVVKLLGHHQYDLENKTLEAEVSVLVNNKNELVVVSVNSNDATLIAFVTSKLNYKKIDGKGIAKRSIFTIPLKLT